jgi:hypothetical protein
MNLRKKSQLETEKNGVNRVNSLNLWSAS